jgi:hypothetical protein
MDALASQPQPSPDVIAVAVRLADEGIPVRAIARATHIPSEEIYTTLHHAIAQGSIIEMPRDDWPPGTRRSERTLLIGTPLEDETELKCACARFFKATPLQSAMLALMLRRNEVTKEQLHGVIEQNRPISNKEATDLKMVDVMICNLRKKLKVHNIEIKTLWGLGYLIDPPERERALNMMIASIR